MNEKTDGRAEAMIWNETKECMSRMKKWYCKVQTGKDGRQGIS